MQEVLTYMMNTFGYLGVCFLIAIENIFPPIPSEVILDVRGFYDYIYKADGSRGDRIFDDRFPDRGADPLSGRVGIKPGTAGACDGKPDVSKAWF